MQNRYKVLLNGEQPVPEFEGTLEQANDLVDWLVDFWGFKRTDDFEILPFITQIRGLDKPSQL